MNQLITSILLISSILLFSKCKKEKFQTDDAKIIGIDFRKCPSPACSGYWIEIKQDTLRFLDFPENSKIEELNMDTYFPIEVTIKWKWADDEVLQIVDDLIVVEQLEKK